MSVLVSADTELLTLLALGFLAAVLFQSVIAAVRGWVVDIAAVEAQWSTHLAAHLLRLPLTFFAKRSVGEVLSRFLSVQSVQQTLSTSFVEALLDGLTVVLVLALLLVYSPTLTAWVVAGFAVYALLRAWSYRRLWRLKEGHLVSVARQQSLLIENRCMACRRWKLANRHAERSARLANAANDARQDAAVRRAEPRSGAVQAGVRRTAGAADLAWRGHGAERYDDRRARWCSASPTPTCSPRARRWIDRQIHRSAPARRARAADRGRRATAAGARRRGRICGPITPGALAGRETKAWVCSLGEDEPWIVRDCSFNIAVGRHRGPQRTARTLAKLLLGLPPERGGNGGIDITRSACPALVPGSAR